MFKEFREFALKGNVMDLAIGVIIGAAFGKIVTSFVEDILMPPLGMLIGRVDFSNLFVTLGPGSFDSLAAARAAGAATLNYGVFLNNVMNFLIIAGAVFLMVKQVNRLRRQEPAAAPTTRECPYCLSAVPLAARKCAHCTSDIVMAARA